MLDARVMNKDGIDKRVSCEVIDIPFIYHYLDSNQEKFFTSLQLTDNFDYFKLQPIKKLIEFNYPIVKQYTIRRLFTPYLIFAMMYIMYNFLLYGYFDDTVPFLDYFSIGLAGFLILFSTYFLLNELKQLKDGGLEYLSSIWNYLDLLQPIGVYLLIFLQTYKMTYPNQWMDPGYIAVVQSTTTFLVWFKFFYFMRIFASTGYYIRMIVDVMNDMVAFLLILLVSIVAFADSFLALAMANSEDSGMRFVNGLIGSIIYTYRTILGDMQMDPTGLEMPALAMIFFLICTFFNMIIMLNLLIAIISESFGKVNSNSVNAKYQEMAALIAENYYLIPDDKRESYAKKNLHLLVITDLEAANTEFTDPI